MAHVGKLEVNDMTYQGKLKDDNVPLYCPIIIDKHGEEVVAVKTSSGNAGYIIVYLPREDNEFGGWDRMATVENWKWRRLRDNESYTYKQHS
jgi:hypothetical protein